MSIAAQCLTPRDYLTYSDDTDTSYELVNGELVPMPLGWVNMTKLLTISTLVFVKRFSAQTMIRCLNKWSSAFSHPGAIAGYRLDSRCSRIADGPVARPAKPRSC